MTEEESLTPRRSTSLQARIATKLQRARYQLEASRRISMQKRVATKLERARSRPQNLAAVEHSEAQDESEGTTIAPTVKGRERAESGLSADRPDLAEESDGLSPDRRSRTTSWRRSASLGRQSRTTRQSRTSWWRRQRDSGLSPDWPVETTVDRHGDAGVHLQEVQEEQPGETSPAADGVRLSHVSERGELAETTESTAEAQNALRDSCVLLSTSLGSNAIFEAECRKVVELLTCKRVSFVSVDGALSENAALRETLWKMTGERVYPLLFLDGVLLTGGFAALQKLVDCNSSDGAFDATFARWRIGPEEPQDVASPSPMSEPQAATVLQAAARAMQVRVELAVLHEAATALQASVRGHVLRKALATESAKVAVMVAAQFEDAPAKAAADEKSPGMESALERDIGSKVVGPASGLESATLETDEAGSLQTHLAGPQAELGAPWDQEGEELPHEALPSPRVADHLQTASCGLPASSFVGTYEEASQSVDPAVNSPHSSPHTAPRTSPRTKKGRRKKARRPRDRQDARPAALAWLLGQEEELAARDEGESDEEEPTPVIEEHAQEGTPPPLAWVDSLQKSTLKVLEFPVLRIFVDPGRVLREICDIPDLTCCGTTRKEDPTLVTAALRDSRSDSFSLVPCSTVQAAV